MKKLKPKSIKNKKTITTKKGRVLPIPSNEDLNLISKTIDELYDYDPNNKFNMFTPKHMKNGETISDQNIDEIIIINEENLHAK